MVSSVSLGAPEWTDGSTYNGLALRQFWCATKLYDQGTASAVSCPGGVYPGGGQLQVTAGSGLTVNVAAGYCAVPHPTAGDGAYIFGMMTSGTLTVTASTTGYVVASVQDLGNSSSFCQIEYVSSVPPASIQLAQVVSGASAITTVTDLRTYVAPPGCVFPIAAAASAPAVQAATVMYDVATGTLVSGTGTAGTVAPTGFIQTAGFSLVNTSAGAQGLTPGMPGADPWGIGYGSLTGSNNTDLSIVPEISVSFVADGTSDYEFYYKWQLCSPAESYAGAGHHVSGAFLVLYLALDGVIADSLFHVFGNTTGTTAVTSGPGGSASWYTSAGQGTTLSAGTHTAALYILTEGSFYFGDSDGGVMIGDVHGNGSAIYGAGSTYLSALTAENCILRVMAVPVA